MKTVSMVVVVSLLLTGLAFGQTSFEFNLCESQEVPPTGSGATGSGVGVLSVDETTFDITITHDVVGPTAAHIHNAPPGVNGGIIFNLGDPSSPIIVTWNPDAGEVADLFAGDLYVNIHSPGDPGGEIRGQIVQDCTPGTINKDNGPIADVLYVNGTAGGATRTVSVSEGALIWMAMLQPPSGGNGKFVVHGDVGTRTSGTSRVLPFDIGTTCFPFLSSGGSSPEIVANNVGKENEVGSSEYFGVAQSNPSPAPVIFLQLSSGDAVNLPMGTTLTMQGVEIDPGSVSVKLASTTNAVTVEVMP